jgi:hypothetical protein
MNILIQMWNTAANYTQWQAIWISSVFLLINGGLCATVWYVQRLTIIRYGYTKSRQKRIKKEFKAQTLADKILLRRLRKEATVANPILNLCVVTNYLNIVAIGAEIIGYIGTIITCGQGWALTLVLLSGFISFCIMAFAHSLGGLLWIPSERKRWQP